MSGMMTNKETHMRGPSASKTAGGKTTSTVKLTVVLVFKDEKTASAGPPAADPGSGEHHRRYTIPLALSAGLRNALHLN